MNTSIELIRRSDLAISFTPEAQAMLNDALETAAMIVKVDSELSQKMAVQAQMECARVSKLVEEARQHVKAPIIDAGRKIDTATKQFVAEIQKEQLRIARLAGDYQEHLLAKARSEEAARRKEITDLERTREEQLAKCNTLEARETVHEEFSQLTQAMQPVQAPPRVDGQVVRQEWTFEVTDPYLLARNHPNLVKIEPKRREIKEALELGLTIAGIKATKETVSGVRVSPERKAITIQ